MLRRIYSLSVTREALPLAVHVKPEVLLAFLGYELATAVKRSPSLTYLTGPHEEEKIDDAMKRFLNVVVSCDECGLPEIELIAKGEKVSSTDDSRKVFRIYKQCHACGNTRALVSASDKFDKFLSKNIQPERNA
jgi:translation initiation factor 2 beta subunit (eIF-2beta)/eIF-5